MKNHHKSRDKIIKCQNNIGKPADGIAADRTDIRIKPVQNIPIGILIHRQPVRIHNLIKNLRLDIIVYIKSQFHGISAYQTGKNQTDHRTGHHADQHDPQLIHPEICNNIDQIFAEHRRTQAESRAADSEDRIENN